MKGHDFHPCATPNCTRLAYDKHLLCWTHWAQQQDDKRRAARALKAKEKKS